MLILLTVLLVIVTGMYSVVIPSFSADTYQKEVIRLYLGKDKSDFPFSSVFKSI